MDNDTKSEEGDHGTAPDCQQRQQVSYSEVVHATVILPSLDECIYT